VLLGPFPNGKCDQTMQKFGNSPEIFNKQTIKVAKAEEELQFFFLILVKRSQLVIVETFSKFTVIFLINTI
jgi:hypothetical protein